jgi:glucose-1-phosphate adenylyltransferase
MYDEDWPIRTYQPNYPPPKFVFADANRRGLAMDSIVCLGTIISGGQVERSILGPQTRVNSFAHVEDSILFARVGIGRHCRIRRAIIDKGVQIPAGAEIGFDHDLDRRRGFHHTENGITVIAKSDGAERFLEAKP